MSDPHLIRPAVNPLPLSEVLQLLPEAELVSTAGVSPNEISVSGVSVATNDLEPGWLFIASPGQRSHGASYSHLAEQAGAAAVVTDVPGLDLAKAAGLPVICVPDPRKAAALLAEAFHGETHQGLVKVGVTGTNGKTTTTYFVRAVLQAGLGQTALFGTIEINTGKSTVYADRTTHEVPVVQRALALAAQEGSKAAVIEVSSHALELGRVERIHFDLGIFTNLQHDHLDFHGDMDHYLEAKAKLFAPGRTKQAVIAVDDAYGRKLAASLQIPVTGVQVLTSDPLATDFPLWRVKDIAPDPATGGGVFTLLDPTGAATHCSSPLPGEANAQDAALALVAGVQLGIPLDVCVQALSSAPPVPGRMHWIARPSPDAPSVLVDYAHTPEAVDLLLRTVRPAVAGRIIAVFGTDGDRDATKRVPLAETFAERADILVVTDENPRSEDPVNIRAQLLQGVRNRRPDLSDTIEVSEGRAAAIAKGIGLASPGDLVLIAGKGAERKQEWASGDTDFYDPDVAAAAFIEAGYQVKETNV